MRRCSTTRLLRRRRPRIVARGVGENVVFIDLATGTGQRAANSFGSHLERMQHQSGSSGEMRLVPCWPEGLCIGLVMSGVKHLRTIAG